MLNYGIQRKKRYIEQKIKAFVEIARKQNILKNSKMIRIRRSFSKIISRLRDQQRVISEYVIAHLCPSQEHVVLKELKQKTVTFDLKKATPKRTGSFMPINFGLN